MLRPKISPKSKVRLPMVISEDLRDITTGQSCRKGCEMDQERTGRSEGFHGDLSHGRIWYSGYRTRHKIVSSDCSAWPLAHRSTP